MSIEQFRTWSPQAMRDAASDISGQLQSIIGIGDQLDSAALPAGWTGQAADAATAALGRLTSGIREAAADSMSVRGAIESAATEVEAQQQALTRIETFAADNGLAIAPDGHLIDIQPPPRRLEVTDGPIAAIQRQQVLDDVAQRLRALVEQADGTDARLAAVISGVD